MIRILQIVNVMDRAGIETILMNYYRRVLSVMWRPSLAVSFRKVDGKTYVYDFGQNMAGVTRIRLSGERGTEVRIKHGERLYPDGRLDLLILMSIFVVIRRKTLFRQTSSF